MSCWYYAFWGSPSFILGFSYALVGVNGLLLIYNSRAAKRYRRLTLEADAAKMAYKMMASRLYGRFPGEPEPGQSAETEQIPEPKPES